MCAHVCSCLLREWKESEFCGGKAWRPAPCSGPLSRTGGVRGLLEGREGGIRQYHILGIAAPGKRGKQNYDLSHGGLTPRRLHFSCPEISDHTHPYLRDAVCHGQCLTEGRTDSVNLHQCLASSNLLREPGVVARMSPSANLARGVTEMQPLCGFPIFKPGAAIEQEECGGGQ